MTYSVLDLFSGIGGFSLGLERTGGFKTVAFCEIEPFCQRVLAKHWPGVPIYDDIRQLTAARLAADGIVPDVLCGGFPCQDISEAGKRAGLDGERSGLWSEIRRLASDLRPKYLIVENVSNLLSGPAERPGWWFGRVLSDLAEIGFDAEWHSIPAAAVGAPHERDRVWLVAYPNGIGCGCGGDPQRHPEYSLAGFGEPQEGQQQRRGRFDWPGAMGAAIPDANCQPLVGTAIARQEHGAWPPEPGVCRVVDGVPRELVEPRIKALGNAVVPQIPEIIGRAILATAPAPDSPGDTSNTDESISMSAASQPASAAGGE